MEIKEHQERINNIKDITKKIIVSSNDLYDVCSQFNLPEFPIEKRIKLAKKDLKRLYLTKDLKLVINEIIEELTYIIPLEDFILKGVFWRAITQWQLKHSEPILVAMQKDRTEQFKIGIEILGYVRILLARSIFLPNKKQKKLFLDEVFRKSVELLEELLSVLDFLNNPDNQEYIIDFEINNWLEGNYTLQ
jgi:hypothetical protein